MKKQTYIIYICIAVAICIIPFAAMGIHKTETTSENKTLAKLPSITNEDGSFNINYMSMLGDYFLDRFAFRQELVSLNGTLSAKLLNTSTVDDVIVGDNDWLYYSATLDDFRHDNSVSERMLYNMAHNTRIMQDYCEADGGRFVFTIAPNKNSLYGENMPSKYKYMISAESDAERLAKYLDSEGVNYVDMFELFNSQDEVLYYKKDSHWNNKGAVLAYNALLDAVQVEHESYEDTEPDINNTYIGDLNRMLYADYAEPETDYCYREIFPFAYLNPEATVEDMTIETINPSANGNLLMYRDSFGNSLLPYMASAFENAYFSKVVPYPLSDEDIIEPDVYIVEKVERHLPTLAQVPPQLRAVEIFEEINATDCEEETVAVSVSDEAGFTKLSGILPSEGIDDDSPIYLKVQYKDDVFVYNAFCVSSKESDFGFAAYINPEIGEIQEISVVGLADGKQIMYSTQME